MNLKQPTSFDAHTTPFTQIADLLGLQGLPIIDKGSEIVGRGRGNLATLQLRTIHHEKPSMLRSILAVQRPTDPDRSVLFYGLEILHRNEDAENVASRCRVPRDLREQTVSNVRIDGASRCHGSAFGRIANFEKSP